MKNYKFAAVLLLLIVPFILMAHPPKKVNLKYDKETKILSICLPHAVKDINKHYIDKITISVNGEEFKVLEYKAQTSEASHKVEIKLPDLKKGDKVKVEAKCNKMGKKSSTIVIK